VGGFNTKSVETGGQSLSRGDFLEEYRAQVHALSEAAAAGARKVVLATSIAESSLTIEGVRCVVDCGLARVPVQDPVSGLTQGRLSTVPVSKASAEQRRGRAGDRRSVPEDDAVCAGTGRDAWLWCQCNPFDAPPWGFLGHPDH
jgi:hypothetical protein